MTTDSIVVGAPASLLRRRSLRWGGLVRGRAEDPAWVRPTLLALLVGTGLLYLIGLGIQPEAVEVIVPTYLWRFRKSGQFKEHWPGNVASPG